MKIRNIFLAPSLAALLLVTGCSAGAETPYLGSSDDSSSTTSQAVTSDSTAATENPTENPSANPEATPPGEINATADPANPFNKGADAKPYVEGDKYEGPAGILQEGEQPIPAANADMVDKEQDSRPSTVTLDGATISTLSAMNSRYQNSIASSNWDTACAEVYLREGKTLADCVKYHAEAGTFLKQEFDFTQAGMNLNPSTQVLTIKKSGNEDMGLTQAEFINANESGSWKVFVSALA